MTQPLEIGQCLGRKLLIVGDVNTGKTTLARRILRDFCARGLGPRIAILDFSPTIPPAIAQARGVRGVGGMLETEPTPEAVTVHPMLQAPRLTSSSDAQAAAKAQDNQRLIDAAWQGLAPGRDILFVNDVSMYLQAGEAGELIARFAPADTVIANGYFGQRLGAGELTRRERAQMQRLCGWFERVGRVVTLETRDLAPSPSERGLG